MLHCRPTRRRSVEDSGLAQTVTNNNYVTRVLSLILSQLRITIVYHYLIHLLHKFGYLDSKCYTTFAQKSCNVVEHNKCVLRNVVHGQLIINNMVVCHCLVKGNG